MAFVKPEIQKTRLDLSGPQGNAFVLLGMASEIGKQLKLSDDKKEFISNKMKESDYTHLVQVFHHYFGDFVDIVLTDDMSKDWNYSYNIFDTGLIEPNLSETREISVIRKNSKKM